MAIDEERERLYNARAAVADHGDFFARWELRSAGFRETARARLSLPYGPSARQSLDLFMPDDAARPPPLVMFIHGGYWQGLDKSLFSYLAEALTAAGAAAQHCGERGELLGDRAPRPRHGRIPERYRKTTPFPLHPAPPSAPGR